MIKHNHRIEIWGSYPPPIGGVTIHVMRLIHRLNKKHHVILKDFQGHTETGYDYIIPVKNPLLEIIKLLTFKRKVIHVNSSSSFIIVLSLLPFLKYHHFGATIHGMVFWKCHGIKKSILSYYMRHLKFIIMNDKNAKQEFCDYLSVKPEIVHILPAFIPPTDIERVGICDAAKIFRKKHSFLISANAFKLKFDSNGDDLYGLDMLVKLVCNLRSHNIDAGLLFCLPEIGDIEYFKKIKEYILEHGLEEHVLFVNEVMSNGFEYWELSDLFIRPTTTDMEGLSVKEALFMGTHVIASDVCQRPEECVLFESRNQEELNRKVMNLYQSQGYKERVKYCSMTDTPKEMLKIYQSL